MTDVMRAGSVEIQSLDTAGPRAQVAGLEGLRHGHGERKRGECQVEEGQAQYRAAKQEPDDQADQPGGGDRAVG